MTGKVVVGSVFGSLTVTGLVHGLAACDCACGGNKRVLAYNLRRGATQSCGCARPGYTQRRIALGARPHPLDALLSRVRWDSGCWIFAGANNGAGYGQVRVGRVTRYAHRFAYEQLVGPIPRGLVVDRLCRTPACINPLHLECVSVKENTRRGLASG